VGVSFINKKPHWSGVHSG